jgi:hypothetical protein
MISMLSLGVEAPPVQVSGRVAVDIYGNVVFWFFVLFLFGCCCGFFVCICFCQVAFLVVFVFWVGFWGLFGCSCGCGLSWNYGYELFRLHVGCYYGHG